MHPYQLALSKRANWMAIIAAPGSVATARNRPAYRSDPGQQLLACLSAQPRLVPCSSRSSTYEGWVDHAFHQTVPDGGTRFSRSTD